MPGKLITFEGPEGGGKSTVCSMVRAAFSGTPFLVVREPGTTPAGERIRSILQQEDMPDRAELLLFEAARACIVDEIIKPALANDTNVICDRFYDSTVVYQGYGRGLSFVEIDFLNNMATGGIVPDLTVVFDLDPNVGMARKGKATDRIEAAGPEFHDRVRQGFLELAKSNSRFAIVDASRTCDEVVESVVGLMETKLGWRRTK